MELSAEQKKALDEQKQQCIFCKIIKGETPSKKVYEDDKVIAVLDINPAVKGHVLLMPKEHYPIMPLIPPEVFEHMAVVTRQMSDSIKKAMVVGATNIFIANGGAAGQQSNHFMLHLIPRESGDGISGFNLKEEKLEESKVNEVHSMLSANLPQMLKGVYAKHPLKTQPQAQAPQKITKEEVIKIINDNQQLKDMIKKNPSQLKQMIPSNPQLKMMFKDVDVDEIIGMFVEKKEEKKEDKKDDVDLDDVSSLLK